MIYFTAHTFKCVCHCRRAMFRVLGMYNFALVLWFVCTCACAKPFPKIVPMVKLDISTHPWILLQTTRCHHSKYFKLGRHICSNFKNVAFSECMNFTTSRFQLHNSIVYDLHGQENWCNLSAWLIAGLHYDVYGVQWNGIYKQAFSQLLMVMRR